jgi:4-hydroxy-3-polyprenylbenzoate decarboxylase
MKRIVVGITGASGSVYGLRLVEELLAREVAVTLLLTNAGRQVTAFETGLNLPEAHQGWRAVLQEYFRRPEQLDCPALDDFFAPIASGTSAPDAVVICPCSMGTVGRVAAGLSENLLERVADVALKERRELILVPRETPFNQIHLENLLRLSRAGAHILPAMPGFYHCPQTVAELVDFVVGKVLDQLGLEHQLYQRWGKEQG